MVSPNYKPSGGITLSVGGLAPPSMTRRAGGLEDFACGGLPNVSSAPSPCMRSTSLACQMALPGSLPKKSAPPGGILSLEVSTPTSQPLSLDAMVVRPTLADSTTMLALHKQLKSQHIQDWLKLLDSAGLRSELFATTNDSLNATLHRSKVIARFAPSTLAAYLKSWNQWSEFCACSGGCPFQPSVLAVADYLRFHRQRVHLVLRLLNLERSHGWHDMLASQCSGMPSHHPSSSRTQFPLSWC